MRANDAASNSIADCALACRARHAPRAASSTSGAWSASASNSTLAVKQKMPAFHTCAPPSRKRSRIGERRLFDETRDRLRGRRSVVQRVAAFDVAEAGFRVRRPHAERDQVALARDVGRAQRGAREIVEPADQVIGRHHQQRDIAAEPLRGEQRAQRHGTCGVARVRLEQEHRLGRGIVAERRIDVARSEEIVAMGDRHQRGGPRDGRRAARGSCEQGLAVGQRQERLGRGLARQGPQSGPRAAAEDDRYQHDGRVAVLVDEETPTGEYGSTAARAGRRPSVNARRAPVRRPAAAAARRDAPQAPADGATARSRPFPSPRCGRCARPRCGSCDRRRSTRCRSRGSRR